MNVSLVIIVLQLIIIGIIYGSINKNVHKLAMFKTKRPRYVMRGKLVTPVKPHDYCQKGLCPSGVKHLACNSSFWSEECSKPRDGVEKNVYWMIALTIHNILRVRLSRQAVIKMPRAELLPVMRWSDELADMAMRITNYCNDEAATKCVNTPHYLHVSRNTKIIMTKYMMGIERMWKEVITLHWLSYMFEAEESFIQSYPENPTLQQSRMANILLQENTHVGCGTLLRAANLSLIFYVACVYNSSPKPGRRVYDIYKNT